MCTQETISDMSSMSTARSGIKVGARTNIVGVHTEVGLQMSGHEDVQIMEVPVVEHSDNVDTKDRLQTV